MSRPARLATVAAVIAVLAGACGDAPPEIHPAPATPRAQALFPVTLTDDEGAQVTLRAEPRRIVTFAPSHTEILFALGLGERVIGVSGPFDDYPPEARDIEEVGGPGGTEPNVEQVVALEPDLLLTAFIGGEWKSRLRDLGVPVFTTLASSFDDTLEDILSIGRLTGTAEVAADLVAGMTDEAESIEEAVSGQPTVTCFLELSDLFTVGPGSLEFDLLQRAGCQPVTGSAENPYPQWSIERLLRDDPDVYLASEFGQSVDAVTDRPGIRSLRAVREGRVFLVDGDLISRPGPRVIEGIRVLAEALHPRAA